MSKSWLVRVDRFLAKIPLSVFNSKNWTRTAKPAKLGRAWQLQIKNQVCRNLSQCWVLSERLPYKAYNHSENRLRRDYWNTLKLSADASSPTSLSVAALKCNTELYHRHVVLRNMFKALYNWNHDSWCTKRLPSPMQSLVFEGRFVPNICVASLSVSVVFHFQKNMSPSLILILFDGNRSCSGTYWIIWKTIITCYFDIVWHFLQSSISCQGQSAWSEYLSSRL